MNTQENLNSRLQTELSTLVGMDIFVSIFVDINNLIIEVQIVSRPYQTRINIDKNLIEGIMSDQQAWDALLQNISERLQFICFKSVRFDLEQIEDGVEFYVECLDQTKINITSYSGKSNDEELRYLGCALFADRYKTNLKTISFIASSCEVTEFLSMELSLGILLRTGTLDAKMITAWKFRPNLIIPILVDSFQWLPSDLDQPTIDKYKEAEDYFNINSLKKGEVRARIREIDDIIKSNLPVTNQYIHTYSFYSKYDHISIIPKIEYHSPLKKLVNMADALHFFKYAIGYLSEIAFDGSDQDYRQLHTILGIKI